MADLSYLENVHHLSEEDVIKELEACGIQVILKPIAIMNERFQHNEHSKGYHTGTTEVDIYDALQKIRNRKAFSKDPFAH